MNPDHIYRQGFLRAVRLMQEVIDTNRTLPIHERMWLVDVLTVLEKQAEKPMLTEMQGVI